MEDYTKDQQIVKGYRWPAYGDPLTVTLEHPNGWPAGADTWNWFIKFDSLRMGGTPALKKAADSVTLSGTDLVIEFKLTGDDTDKLTVDRDVQKYQVDIVSDNTTDDIADVAKGYAYVRLATGTAE